MQHKSGELMFLGLIFQIPGQTAVDTHCRSSFSMIEKAAELANSGRALVLGCGKCSEIPIHFMRKKCSQIDLVDIDVNAIRALKAECQLKVEPGDSFGFHCADLTGLIPQIETRAQQLVEKTSDPSQCLCHLGHLLTLATPKFWTQPNGEKYKLIICSTILTQLQATVRNRVEDIFLKRFPQQHSELATHQVWKKNIWEFARKLEDAFINHLRSLAAPGAIIYLSATVHVGWLIQSDAQTLTTEGYWIATRTSRLADYLRNEEVFAEQQWKWFRKEPEGPYWGRLYGIQAIIFRFTKGVNQ
jgi:hypothetical protein